MSEPAFQRPAPIPLQVLTGFLGAGKTTLLNRLLKSPLLADTVVVVNEFGEIGLDHDLIQGAEDGMVLLEAGCVCCTVKGELVTTLEDLLRRRDNGRIVPFKRVILETTGLADPAPILQAVLSHPYFSLRYQLDGVITVVDAESGLATLESEEEAVRQVAVADVLVLSKTDRVADAKPIQDIQSTLAAINPGALILDSAQGQADPERLIGLGLFDLVRKPREVEAWLAIEEALGPTRHVPTGGPHGAIQSLALTHDRPIRSQTLDMFWSLLRSTQGQGLLRLKGIVDVAEHPSAPLAMHAVRQVMHPPLPLPGWPSAQRRSRLVIIGRGLDRQAVAGLWQAFLAES